MQGVMSCSSSIPFSSSWVGAPRGPGGGADQLCVIPALQSGLEVSEVPFTGDARRAWVLGTGPVGDGRDHLPLKSTLRPPSLPLLAGFAVPARPCLAGAGGSTRGEHRAAVPGSARHRQPQLQPAAGLTGWIILQLVKRPAGFAACPRPAPNECRGALQVKEEAMRCGGSPWRDARRMCRGTQQSPVTAGAREHRLSLPGQECRR